MTRRPRRLRRAALIGAVALPTFAAGALASGVFDKPLAEPFRVECYSGPSLNAKRTSARIDEASGARSPRGLCSPFYERGYLAKSGSRPTLVACFEEGIVRVFPGGGGVCRRLGLEEISDAQYERERVHIRAAFKVAEAAIARARGATVSQSPNGATLFGFSSSRCVPVRPAAEVVRDALAAAGYRDFKVRVEAGATGSTCASGVDLPATFDGRTFELLGIRSSIGAPGEALPRVAEPEENLAAGCADPTGAAAGRDAHQVITALRCHGARRADSRERNCFTADEIRSIGRQVLDRQGLHEWRVTVRGGPPPKSRYRLGYLMRPSVDPRVREVRLRLSPHCLDYGLGAPEP
jgi:hypothetical protein